MRPNSQPLWKDASGTGRVHPYRCQLDSRAILRSVYPSASRATNCLFGYEVSRVVSHFYADFDVSNFWVNILNGTIRNERLLWANFSDLDWDSRKWSENVGTYSITRYKIIAHLNCPRILLQFFQTSTGLHESKTKFHVMWPFFAAASRRACFLSNHHHFEPELPHSAGLLQVISVIFPRGLIRGHCGRPVGWTQRCHWSFQSLRLFPASATTKFVSDQRRYVFTVSAWYQRNNGRRCWRKSYELRGSRTENWRDLTAEY